MAYNFPAGKLGINIGTVRGSAHMIFHKSRRNRVRINFKKTTRREQEDN